MKTLPAFLAVSTLCGVLSTAPSRAADAPVQDVVGTSEVVRVESRVTSNTAGSYYLDKGRAAGIAVGDRVVLYPTGGTTSEGTVRAVSKNTARVELDVGGVGASVGDRVEVVVPRSRLAGDSAPNASKPAGQGTAPDHPAWAHPEENWAPNQPLLAPAFGLSPEEREPRIRGRAYIQAQGTWDNQGGTRTYYSGSLGADATMENPFGQGGSFRIDASVWTRGADADGIDSQSQETRLRLSRFTYEFGGTDDRPTRWQFGRFLQHEFPAFGLLDGVEWNRRLGPHDVVGASVGAMPEPFSDMKSFQDLQAAVFYRHSFDEKRRNRVGFGYQNTWHKGEQDRNLFVADADVRPTNDLSLHSSAWIDHYGSEDVVKDQGFELTEFLVSANWNATSTTGLGATYSNRRIPELLRNEFARYDAAQLDRNVLDRVALYGWWMASTALRFDARVDHWSDQDDSGSNVELGGSLRDVLWNEGELRASVFRADGSFSSGPGFRAQGSKAFGRTYASLGYEFVDYEQKDFTGEQRKLGQHAVFGSLDLPVFVDWDLSLTGEKRFGDEQDSYTLSLLMQTHF